MFYIYRLLSQLEHSYRRYGRAEEICLVHSSYCLLVPLFLDLNQRKILLASMTHDLALQRDRYGEVAFYLDRVAFGVVIVNVHLEESQESYVTRQ